MLGACLAAPESINASPKDPETETGLLAGLGLGVVLDRLCPTLTGFSVTVFTLLIKGFPWDFPVLGLDCRFSIGLAFSD